MACFDRRAANFSRFADRLQKNNDGRLNAVPYDKEHIYPKSHSREFQIMRISAAAKHRNDPIRRCLEKYKCGGY